MDAQDFIEEVARERHFNFKEKFYPQLTNKQEDLILSRGEE